MSRSLVVLVVVPFAAAALSAAAIALSLPWLRSYVQARPEARSSHREPTPQGGGLGVMLSTFATVWCAAAVTQAWSADELWQLSMLTGAAALLAVVGFVDDVRHVSPVTRLILQCVAAGFVIASVSPELRVLPAAPLWFERLCILLVGIWFINLVNFMDGIDWMTVAEVVPVTGGIVVLGAIGVVPPLATVVALALLGAMVGFAPFNKPTAQVFLGDVGSLPIGLVLGWLLLLLAVNGHWAAALLLPLYYLADASLTLIQRMGRREPVWKAHRLHYYQRAVDGGFTVRAVVARVFALNVALAALAVASLASAASPAGSVVLLIVGMALVGIVLRQFAQGRAALSEA